MARTTNDAADDRMGPELLRGSLDLMVLSVLAGGAKYGYALQKSLRSDSGGAVEVQAGTLYPLLHRLEQDGLIASRWEGGPDDGGGRRRKWYDLTPAGRRRLRDRAAEWYAYVECVRGILEAALPAAPELRVEG